MAATEEGGDVSRAESSAECSEVSTGSQDAMSTSVARGGARCGRMSARVCTAADSAPAPPPRQRISVDGLGGS